MRWGSGQDGRARYGTRRRIRHDTPIKRESRGWQSRRGSREPRRDGDGAGFIRQVFRLQSFLSGLSPSINSPAHPQSLASPSLPPRLYLTSSIQTWHPRAPRPIPTSTPPPQDPQLAHTTSKTWPQVPSRVLPPVPPPPRRIRAPLPIH